MAETDRTGYGPGTYAHNEGIEAARERVQLRREVEQSDRADEALADQILLERVGTADFEDGRRALQKYLREASPAELQALRNEMPSDGRPLNADQLMTLASRAIGALPTDPKEIDAELAAGRERMADPRSGWFADSRAQVRYRALLRARGLAKD